MCTGPNTREHAVCEGWNASLLAGLENTEGDGEPQAREARGKGHAKGLSNQAVTSEIGPGSSGAQERVSRGTAVERSSLSKASLAEMWNTGCRRLSREGRKLLENPVQT